MSTSLLMALVLGQVNVQVSPPAIRFEAPPPLVLVAPGIQVVESFDGEVFVVDGRYWSRSGNRWFVANDHRGRWVLVEKPRVPVALVRVPPGKYRQWSAAKAREYRQYQEYKAQRHQKHRHNH